MDHFVHFLLYLTYKVIIHCYFNLSRPYCKTPLPQSKRVWQRCCPAPQRDSLPGWTRRTNTLFSGHYFGTQDPREEQRLNINLQIWIPWDILELGKKICLGIPSPVSPLFFFTYFYVIHIMLVMVQCQDVSTHLRLRRDPPHHWRNLATSWRASDTRHCKKEIWSCQSLKKIAFPVLYLVG